jgi:hypothetical protein
MLSLRSVKPKHLLNAAFDSKRFRPDNVAAIGNTGAVRIDQIRFISTSRLSRGILLLSRY